MAEFLAGGDAHAALGAKGVSLFRMQQETAAGAAIPLANFIRDLAVGALRHGGPPKRRNQLKANYVKYAHEIAKPWICQSKIYLNPPRGSPSGHYEPEPASPHDDPGMGMHLAVETQAGLFYNQHCNYRVLKEKIGGRGSGEVKEMVRK
jgi:hypothetical protein